MQLQATEVYSDLRMTTQKCNINKLFMAEQENVIFRINPSTFIAYNNEVMRIKSLIQ
jgi:hypothetical protein